jgi:hypothetical protein
MLKSFNFKLLTIKSFIMRKLEYKCVIEEPICRVPEDPPPEPDPPRPPK